MTQDLANSLKIDSKRLSKAIVTYSEAEKEMMGELLIRILEDNDLVYKMSTLKKISGNLMKDMLECAPRVAKDGIKYRFSAKEISDERAMAIADEVYDHNAMVVDRENMVGFLHLSIGNDLSQIASDLCGQELYDEIVNSVFTLADKNTSQTDKEEILKYLKDIYTDLFAPLDRLTKRDIHIVK